MMADLKAFLFNIGGHRYAPSAKKSEEKLLYMHKHFGADFHVGILIETHEKDDDELHPLLAKLRPTHNIFIEPTNTASGDTHAGVTFLLHTDYNLISSHNPIPGRVINFQIQHIDNGQTFNIIALYNYTHNANKVLTKTVTDAIKTVMSDDMENILLGDFNFVDNDLDRTRAMSVSDKVRTKVWNEEMEHLDLIDVFRSKNPKKTAWSNIASNKTGARLDRVYVGENTLAKIVNYKHINTPFAGTHRIVSFTIKGDTPRGKGYYKINTSIFKQNAYKLEIEKLIEDMEQVHANDDIHWWVIFIGCVRSISISYSRERSRVKRNLKNALLKDLKILEEDPIENKNLKNNPEYIFLTERLRVIELQEIEGYKRRVKYASTYEDAEHEISFYAKMEAKQAAKNTIPELAEAENAQTFSNTDSILKIVTDFYKDLYSKKKTYRSSQKQVLSLIKNKLTEEQKVRLDAVITLEELQHALNDMKVGKSPGLDGVPIEFFKAFWPLVQHRYLAYIQRAQVFGFPDEKNTSATILIYKDKGETYLLIYYRPISLINTDLKILCKVLSNRMKPVLKDIIHSSQTCVPGRQIDQTVHLLRDMIDISNEDNLQTAFVFLDQEKAFDRVNHNFLFRTLEGFGFGPVFIDWIKTIYGNASTRVKVNGFLTEKIPLHSGVRQGCPLSALLYVLVIEILALQLRNNSQIVGFIVGGERIVSLHYADDAIIVMKQNACFKWAYKELKRFESASAAKINWSKTEGLLTGSWRQTNMTEWGITWTNKNVKNLGIFQGNDNPGKETFDNILPKCYKTLNFWKQFRLSQIGKSRVVETFITSQLAFASKFHTVPPDMLKKLQKQIVNYINSHSKGHAFIAQQEMWKLKLFGGIKLINVEAKCNAFKIQWLIKLLNSPDLTQNLATFHQLVGDQPGLQPEHKFFLPTKTLKSKIRFKSEFYKDSLLALSKLDLKKGVQHLGDEYIFYNPIIFKEGGDLYNHLVTLTRRNISTYSDLCKNDNERVQGRPYSRKATEILNTCRVQHDRVLQHTLLTSELIEVWIPGITHSILYQDLISKSTNPHSYEGNWQIKMPDILDWELIWATVHNKLATNSTKTAIWQITHLRYNSMFFKNRWYKTHNKCPMCKHEPLNEFHVIFDCRYVNTLWADLAPVLRRIHNTPLTDNEIAFGITTPKNDAVMLRNWLTFTLRAQITWEEGIANYKSKSYPDINAFKFRFNALIKQEIVVKKEQHIYRNTLHKYARIITFGNVVCNNIYTEDINDIFPL